MGKINSTNINKLNKVFINQTKSLIVTVSNFQFVNSFFKLKISIKLTSKE